MSINTSNSTHTDDICLAALPVRITTILHLTVAAGTRLIHVKRILESKLANFQLSAMRVDVCDIHFRYLKIRPFVSTFLNISKKINKNYFDPNNYTSEKNIFGLKHVEYL